MIPNPYVIIGLLVAFIVEGIGAYFYGHKIGGDAANVKWQQRELTQQAAADAKYKDLESKYRLAEQQGAEQLAQVSTDYQKDIQYVTKKNDDLVARLRSGAIWLRDPGATACPASGSTVPPATASASGRDGGPTGLLSREASEFLFDLTAEADQLSDQLAACQAVVRRDREIVNSK